MGQKLSALVAAIGLATTLSTTAVLALEQAGVDKPVSIEFLFPFYNAKHDGATGNGSTDDRVNLQLALDNAPSGATIIVPDGIYMVSRVNPGTTDYCLNITKPVHLALNKGAAIKLADGEIVNGTDLCSVIQINSSNVTISGEGSVDMNRAGQTDTTIGTNIGSRICIDSNGGTYSDIKIHDILVKDAMGDGIRLKGANNTTGALTGINIHNIKMENCREGMLFHWANNILCSNNHLSMDNSTDAQDGFETSECNNSIFLGNYVENAKGSGFDLFFSGEVSLCVGNIAINCGSGIALGNNTSAGGTGKDYLVSSNMIKGVVTTFGIGVYLTTGADRVLLDNNTITNVLLQHAYDIRAGSTIKIVGGIVNDVVLGRGVHVGAGVVKVSISGVDFSDLLSINSDAIRCDSDNAFIHDNEGTNIGGAALILNGDSINARNNIFPSNLIDDNGTSNRVIGNDVSAIDNVGATTPIDHNNIIGGTWTT